MSDIYAMQRANGDWFALDDHGRFRVPLFNSSHDAMTARSRNWGMLLFKPVKLAAHLLNELVPIDGGGKVDFWLVNDPLISLNRGCLVERAQLDLLIGNSTPLQTMPGNGNSFDIPRLGKLPRNGSSATEAWEDEGGKYAKCA